MPIRFSHTPPNFALAFILAPLAGAMATFIVALAWSPYLLSRGELTAAGYVIIPGLIALYALAISAIYTLVVGSGVVIFVRRAGRTPGATTATSVGIIVGFLPYAGCAVSELRGTNVFEPSFAARVSAAALTPTIALAASVATALAFWYLGLRNRQPVV